MIFKKHPANPLLILSLSIIVILLQGCRAHTENPTIKISIDDDYNGYAVSAERRLVIANGDSICAEPSPDAAQALLSLFSLSGSLGGTAAGNMSAGTTTQQRETAGQAGANAGVNAQAAMSELVQTTPFQLFNRSQGVQFYRDSIYALCQMTMNGWIFTRREYQKYGDPKEGSGNNQSNIYSKYSETYNDYLDDLNTYNNRLSVLIESLPSTSSAVSLERAVTGMSALVKFKPQPPNEPEIELSRIMGEIRKDAKEIIIAEVSKSDIQEQLEEMRNRLAAANKNAADKSAESAISQAKLEIVEQMLEKLKLNVNINH